MAGTRNRAHGQTEGGYTVWVICVCSMLFQVHAFAYPRQCPRLQPDGSPCPYVAWRDVGFRRHLVVWHNLRWAVYRRSHHAREDFIEMTPAEAAQRRAKIANRQGGRQERAAYASRRAAEDHREMPAPPPPARRRCPRLPLPHQLPPGRQPPPSTHSHHRAPVSSPPPECAKRTRYSRLRVDQSFHCRSPDKRMHRPAVNGCRPAGYQSTPQESVSSLSECGFSNDDHRLSDGVAEFDEGCSKCTFDDLYIPAFNVGAIRNGPNVDSGIEAVNLNEIFGNTEHDCDSGDFVSDNVGRGQIPQDRPFSRAPAAASVPPTDSVILPRVPVVEQHIPRSSELFLKPDVSVPALTTEESQGPPLFHILRDTATSPRPMTPPPARYSVSAQAEPEMHHVTSQIQPSTSDVGVWTGELPRPWLSTPHVNLRRMAELQVMLAETDQLCSVRQMADKITANGQYAGTTVSQKRTIHLLVNYGFEVLRYAAGHLLGTMSNRHFHQHDNVPWEQTSRDILDTLNVWNRRPVMPREPPFSELEEEFDWLM